ncbi:MAG TPA: OmpA family protein [Rhodocyclaceae bacterium]
MIRSSPLFAPLLALAALGLLILARRYGKPGKALHPLRVAAMALVVPILYVADWHRREVDGEVMTDAGIHAASGTSISLTQGAALASLASQTKPAIEDFFQREDRLPRGSEAGSLPPGARLLDNGALELSVDGQSGTAVHWRLSPNAGNIGWTCVTRTVSNIADYLSGCRYDPSFKEDQPIVTEYVVEDRLHFRLGMSDRNGLQHGDGAKFAAMVAALAGRRVQDIQISGFADPSGPTEGNGHLAEARAQTVRELFVAAGVDRSLIGMRVVGVDPAAPPHCLALKSRQERSDCLSPSRRVDFRIKARRTL